MECVQCGYDMDDKLELEKNTLYVCLRPNCPNFGLFQVGIQGAFDFKSNQRKNASKA